MKTTRTLPTALKLFVFLLALAALGPIAGAQTTFTKANNPDNMNLGTSWTSNNGTTPGANDIALWSNPPLTGANSAALGANLAWLGIQITNPGGAVTISGPGSNTLTLGGSGIDASTSAQSLSLFSLVTLGANQTWSFSGSVFQNLASSITNGGNTLTIAGGNVQIGANLSGAGGFTKTGASQVAFVGDSTYTGTTTVNSTVSIGNSGATGSISSLSLVTSANNSPLQFFRSTDFTFANQIAGNLRLQKYGAATTTVTGNNTYTGTTQINNGALSVSSLNSVGAGILASSSLGRPTDITNGTIAFGSGASAVQLIYTGSGNETTDRVINLAGTTGSATIDQSGAGTLRFTSNFTATGAGSKTLTLQGSTVGTGEIAGVIVNNTGVNITSVTKAGTGTWTLSGNNTYTGATTVNGGTLTLNRQTGSLAATTALTMGGGTFNMDNAGATGALSQSLGALTFNAGDGTVKTTRTAAQDQAITFSSLAARTAGATGNFVNGGGTNGATNGFVLTGATANTVLDKGIFFGGSAYAAYDTGGFVRAANYAGDTGAVTSGAATTLGNATHQQITGAISAQDNATFTTFNISGNNNLTLNATQTVTVDGILKSGNTAGGATISGGSGIQAATNAELVIRTDGVNDALTISSPILANGANALTKSGAGTLTLSGANTYTGATTVNAGTLAYGASDVLLNTGAVTVAGGTLALSSFSDRVGAVTLSSGSITSTTGVLTGASFSLTDTGSVSAILAGAGATLTKTGSGTAILTGANTYSGNTTVSAGVLEIQNASALGDVALGTIVSAGAALQLQGGITTLAEALTLSGTGITEGGALRNISGANTYAGLVTLGSTTRINSDAGTLTLSGNITGAFGLSVGGAGNTSIASIIGTGTGTLTKDGAGTLTLNAANTYTGATTVKAGTLAYGVANALSSGTVTVSGGTLDISTFSDTVGAVTLASGSITGTTGVLTGTSYSLIDTGSVSAILGGVAVVLTKTGAGTATLSGNNTYTGTTIVTSGTLVLAHNKAAGTSGIAVSGTSSSTLQIASGVTIANNITFSNTNAGSSVSRLVANATNYTVGTSGNLTSSFVGGQADTTASILAGTNAQGSEATLAMRFSDTSAAANDGIRKSDVFTLSGTSTDLFALQLNVTGLDSASFLGWLDGGSWVNAVNGNSGNNAILAQQGYLGSFSAFQGTYGATLSTYVGAYGVDVSGGSTWAVLNHNSDYAAIPEPATWALMAVAGTFFMVMRRRRRD